jgi:probable phosphoglycerate mutase
MRRLLLIRHAESEWNAEGRFQGQADPPLSEKGRRQAKNAASRLTGLVDRIVASDLRRASETAGIVAAELEMSVEMDAAFREIDVGVWSGLTVAEIEEKWPGALDAWRHGHARPHGASEGRREFTERAVAAVKALGARITGDACLVVTHGAFLGSLERELGIHPGVGMPHLGGRWFDVDAELRAIEDRVLLLD